MHTFSIFPAGGADLLLVDDSNVLNMLLLDMAPTLHKSGGPPAPTKAMQDKGERWITIHPHGDKSAKGRPVLIRLNKDGYYHVIGGAGGSMNILRIPKGAI